MDRNEFKDKLVSINRITKVVKGGRRFTFSALVVVGNYAGSVGVGYAKAKQLPDAIKKATHSAKGNLIKIPLREGRTLHHDVLVKDGAGKVLLRSAPSGTGIIAGGGEALRKSIEGAEDKADNAIQDLTTHGFGKGDVIIGISSSGAAKYVQSALNHGYEIGSKTIYLTCNAKPFYPANVDLTIAVDVGPEIITGSTRMIAGTATKMVLNMISTATMIRLGKVYGNLMVDLMAVNEKLVDRGIRIIQDFTNLNFKDSHRILVAAKMSVKTALVMVKKDCNLDVAEKLLLDANGFLRDVID